MFNFLCKNKNSNITTRLFKLENICTPINQLGYWYCVKKNKMTSEQMYWGFAIIEEFYNINLHGQNNELHEFVLKHKMTIESLIHNNEILKNYILKGE